jgi:hypothetical protein
MAQRDASGAPVGLFARQGVDQVHRGEKAYPLGHVRDACDTDGRGQVRLSGARTADEHGVLCAVGERQIGQLHDQRTVDGTSLEVEAGQVPGATTACAMGWR